MQTLYTEHNLSMAKDKDRDREAEEIRLWGWVISVFRWMADYASFARNKHLLSASCINVAFEDIYITIWLQ